MCVGCGGAVGEKMLLYYDPLLRVKQVLQGLVWCVHGRVGVCVGSRYSIGTK